MKENICTKLRFPSNWKKLGVTSLMVFLCISLFASEPIDFDKAFKESVKIEQQIKRTSFPGKAYNIKDFEQDVTSFNKIMGITDHEGKAFNTQCDIILEELEELRWAEDQEERLDAIVDVLYTSIGLIERAKKFGYDVEGAMKAVAENNMTKFIPNDSKAETIITYSEKFYKEEKGKN